MSLGNHSIDPPLTSKSYRRRLSLVVHMVDCPTEIWQVIFAFACTDSGRTGCALSLVSKSVRQLSAPFRYQCIMLEGVPQMSSFLASLERDRDHYGRRNLLHLFLCDLPRRDSSPSSPQGRLGEWNGLLQQLLCTVWHSLRTLTFYLYGVRPFLLPHISLPVLHELNIHGDYFEMPMSPPTSLFPKLSKLHFKGKRLNSPGGIRTGMTNTLLRLIAPTTPSLRHLIITTDSVFDWESALGPPDQGSTLPKLAHLYPLLRRVEVSPFSWKWPRSGPAFEAYQRQWEVLKALSSKEHLVQFGVLEARLPDCNVYAEVKSQWLDGGSIETVP